MGPIGGVTSAQARMAAIDGRFAPPASPALTDPFADGAPRAANGAPVGFDPFGAHYQQALAAPRATPHTASATSVGNAAATATSRGRRSIDVPAELAVHGNGQIPLDRLDLIGQGGHRLWGPAAAAWRSAVDAAAADGIELRITDSYRTYDEQVDLARRKGLYSEGGWAAVPGTSNHGWGLAVDADVTDPATLSWLREHAPRFGFVEAVPREPWHWEYRPSEA